MNANARTHTHTRANPNAMAGHNGDASDERGKYKVLEYKFKFNI